MDRLADARTYVCSLEQSTEPLTFLLDPAMYSYCEKTSTVLSTETEKPIVTPDQCFASRRAAKDTKDTKNIQ